MLDTAGKVLERIIHGRIEKVAEKKLSEKQYGFRKGRSTLDAIDLVVKLARDAISGDRWKNGEKQYCLVATLDIKNTFNSARWDCTMGALAEMDVPGYLRKMVASYFSDRVLKYDTEYGPQEYQVTGGVPQGSVLGPLLWNIMYDGLLNLVLPRAVTPVAFADDVALVIVGKHLEDINNLFEVAFARIHRWMESVGLKLEEHKTEAVLITSRKKLETISLQAGKHEIMSQPFIRYLRVMLDSRLNFKQQAEHASAKVSVVGAVLSQLMPNVGGPKQKRKALLSSVVMSVLTYGISIWANALTVQESHRKVAPAYRLSTLRIASAFRTVSEDAVCVIAGVLPIGVLAEERKTLYYRKGKTSLSAEELKRQERRSSLKRWQRLWDASTKGRWTYRLIPDVDRWYNRSHGAVNYYLTQMISGHRCFRAYLYKFKYEDSPECPTCRGVEENAKHVFKCPRYDPQRKNLEVIVGKEITPENLGDMMLSSEAAWEATSTYVKEILKGLRHEEQERRKKNQKEEAQDIPNPAANT